MLANVFGSAFVLLYSLLRKTRGSHRANLHMKKHRSADF